MALFGPRAMPDLSPECALKRTSADLRVAGHYCRCGFKRSRQIGFIELAPY